MPPGGSTDAAVKAVSPERGRSEAESLDSAAASPTMETVMSRTHRARQRFHLFLRRFAALTRAIRCRMTRPYRSASSVSARLPTKSS